MNEGKIIDGRAKHGRGQRLAVGAWLILASLAVAAEPLASCNVIQLENRPQQTAFLSFGGYFPEAGLDDAMRYRRGPIGEWVVPDEVDPTDGEIRGVLQTPTGPLRIRIEVTLGGRPFRAIREGWIDAALDGSGEQQTVTDDDRVSAEVEVSVDVAELNPDAGAESMTETPRFAGVDPGEWLAGYVQKSGGPIDRVEARWLLAQRSGGPALLELERFSTARTAAAPLLRRLDADHDGRLSADEIERANERLEACDRDEDGDLQRKEVERGLPAGGYRAWHAEPLFAVSTDPPAGDASSDGVVWKVNLSADKGVDGVALLEAADASAVTAAATAIAAPTPFGVLEISAGATPGRETTGKEMTGQVSVGAVVEGSPLWSLIDTDGDDRLSRRERRPLVATLRRLDRDGDGALSTAEVPARIRLAVASGGRVHELLGRSTPAVARSAPEARSVTPDWFASMDANHDGDLVAAEFLGTPDQFAGLDTNGDGLISVDEASPVD